jgi:FlaA1/EpsC-like NDP-sugar epimerase
LRVDGNGDVSSAPSASAFLRRNYVLLEGKSVLITGGTGSLGKTLVRRLLTSEVGRPRKIIVFSRDEAKQHDMRVAYRNKTIASEDIIYHNFDELVEFRLGDVRDYHSVASAVKDADVVLNTAALKQVPTCEYFPYEAVQTNILGAENIVRAVREGGLATETVVGISTDKACKPVNVMGMTKALQERIFLSAGLTCRRTRFTCVRYGNVLASRGSVIPLFHSQIRAGGPVTVTTEEMTRFLVSLDDAVDLIFEALRNADAGETYVPRVPSARVLDVARALIGDRDIPIRVVGIRPGEKVHEVLVSEEEVHRTVRRGKHYVIRSILPELAGEHLSDPPALTGEYTSADSVMPFEQLEVFLRAHDVLLPEVTHPQVEELLR